jgi:thioredoxin 1
MEYAFTDDNFQNEVIKSDIPVLVDFWAPWCGPCRMMAPVIEELAEEIDGSKLKIGKCNVDENPGVAGQYNIMSIPTFLVFQNGKVVEQFIGGMAKSALMDKLARFVG